MSLLKSITKRWTFKATRDLMLNRSRPALIAFKAVWSDFIHLGHRHQSELYSFLVENYGRADRVLDLGIFALPMVEEKDAKTFILEFGDLVAPYIWPERSCPWPGQEGSYEEFGVRVQPGDIVCDVGANVGVFSAYAAFRGAHVYAFEPVPAALKYLHKTVRINTSLPGSIEVVPVALMDRNGTVEMGNATDNMGGTTAVLCKGKGLMLNVPCTTLDDWVRTNSEQRVDFIKADIEGAERNLLKGAVQVLKEYRPRLAICTYHLKDDPAVLTKIIQDANPKYKIHHGRYKLYAF